MIPFADSTLDRSMQDCSVWVGVFVIYTGAFCLGRGRVTIPTACYNSLSGVPLIIDEGGGF